jgi:hypothetical protein
MTNKYMSISYLLLCTDRLIKTTCHVYLCYVLYFLGQDALNVRHVHKSNEHAIAMLDESSHLGNQNMTEFTIIGKNI